MQLQFNPMQVGYFIARLNRFVALVELNGQEVEAHVATSGRLGELLVPGAEVLLEPSATAKRRTPYSLRLVKYQSTWVCIDAQVPNFLVRKAVNQKTLKPFRRCQLERSEPKYEHGRFDFLLQENGQPVLLEVKSVTLVEGEIALFPDAPTERGARHLKHLASFRQEGYRCAVLFIVQRDDAVYFAPNDKRDSAFAQALRHAVADGVEVYAYDCKVKPEEILLGKRLPVLV